MNDKELLQMINQITKYEKPPFKAEDIYYERELWQKFGGVSSGICMRWCWYADFAILMKATEEEIITALTEIEDFYKKVME